MASDKSGLTGSPFEQPGCPTPGAADATTAASKGGYDLGEGSQKETPNSSGLPPIITITDVKDGPAAGSTVQMFIDSPMPVAGNIVDKS